ncbi:MAG TPA: hypothetical protein QGH10_26750 [Armatimonadota bacterium]|nr:hypothetical protein [Armatimonadota bacterium]
MPWVLIVAALVVVVAGVGRAEPAANPMPVGVDVAGSKKYIYDDPVAQDAFEQIGFDFLMHHFWGAPTVEDVDRLDRWAAQHGHSFLINQENSPSGREPGDPTLYRKPGGFFQPPPEYVQRCLATPRFLGFCFDECEHWICNGIWVTAARSFEPHFYDAEGDTLEGAYAGNLLNLQTLMERVFPGFAKRAGEPGQTPVVGTESVLPDLQHLFARAGLVQMPKLLKETITPVTLAMAMGAAKQYGVQHWTSVDLWGMPGYPGHSPEELRSALLISYWTGAERTYIENFSYQGSLYAAKDGQAELSAYGRVARQFIREYLPGHPRQLRFEEFAPEVIIVRFPDSDWGQENPGPWIRRNLYGASNLVPDEETRYWLKVWHVVSHGTIPTLALNYNTPLGIPYRVLFPANNVAVYDHTAADPELYRSARLVFLVGKRVEPECLAALQALAEAGLTVVSTSRLAPRELSGVGPEGYAVHPTGSGRWIVTDDVTLPAVRDLLAPCLGRPDELRYVFGDAEVVFTAPSDPAQVQVAVREL